MPALVTLPVEVIAEILRRLPDRQSLTAASLTCRRLNSCIEAHRFITADVTEADVGEALRLLADLNISATLKTVGRYRAGAFGPYEANWQTWLSQGLDFLRRVEQAGSNKDQRDILVTGLANGTAQPRNSIIDYQMGVAGRMLDSALPYFSEAQIEAMVPTATRNDDTNEGPYTAWRLAHTGTHDYRWVANPEKETLRIIGYVFWDRDRIERWDLEALCGWLKDGADYISTPSDQESTETTWPSMPNFPTTTWAQVLRGRRWR